MIATVDINPRDPNGSILVTSPPRLGPLVKEVPGARLIPKTDTWKLPKTLNAVVQLYGQLGPDHLEFSDEVQDWIDQQKDVEAMNDDARGAAMDPSYWAEYTGPETYLKPYQMLAVWWLRTVGSAVLADDPGTGKTEMAAAWVTEWPLLVAVPNAVKRHWKRRLDAIHPDMVHVILHGTATQRRKQLAEYEEAAERRGALIVSYHQLAIHSRLAPYGSLTLSAEEKRDKELQGVGFKSLVADEAHRAFNPKTKWTRALWHLAENVEHRLVMTGTPAENSPLDMWSLLHAAAPEEWPARSKFQTYYCHTTYDYWGGVERIVLRDDRREEFHRLMATRLLRRTKDVVLPFLPAKQRIPREVELPPKLRKQYNELKKEMISGDITVYDPVVLHARLSQAASALLETTGNQYEIERKDGTIDIVDEVVMTEPSPKVDDLMELLADLPAGTPAGIFARSRQLLDLAATRLEREGFGIVKLVGGQKQVEMDYAIDAFNEGRAQFILVSLGAAAEGVSFTRGSDIVFLDESGSRRENIQAEDRFHGIGRGDQESDHLRIHTIRALDTIEERRRENLDEKDELVADLFDTEKAIAEELT